NVTEIPVTTHSTSYQVDIEEQIISVEFACYLVVSTAALLVIVYIITNVMADFIVFTTQVKFPGQYAFITGTLFAFLITTYVTYYINTFYQLTRVLFMFLLFLTFYIV